MDEQYTYPLNIKWIKSLEPELIRCFGYSIGDYLADECSGFLARKWDKRSTEEIERANQYLNRGSIDSINYAMSFEDEDLLFEVPFEYPENEMEDFIYTYLNKEGDESAAGVLKIVSVLLFKERGMSEDIDFDYQRYTQSIRPDMLNLYLALKEKKQKGPKGTIKEVKISFGGNKPIHLENYDLWFEDMLERYLKTYLGVPDEKSAQRELNTIYPKKTGRKMNQHFNLYAWGIYHLLENTSLRPKKPGSIPLEICRFIHDYMRIVGIIPEKDFTDVQNVRSQLVYLVKQFNTIEELQDAREYKLSPNNKGYSLGRYY